MGQETFPNPHIQKMVVARYRDGRVIRGITHDFGTSKKVFHISSFEKYGKTTREKVFEVFLSDLKAVFFVKSLDGKRDHPPQTLKNEKWEAPGLIKVKVTFFDGEVLVGTTHGYTPDREGFFIVPFEKDSNNLRIYVLSRAVEKVETWR